MSRAHRHHVAFQPPPRQRQVADQVQHLVPHILVGKAQWAILRPVRAQDDRVFRAGAANQAHVAQLLLVGLVAKGARRRNLAP